LPGRERESIGSDAPTESFHLYAGPLDHGFPFASLPAGPFVSSLNIVEKSGGVDL